MLCLRVDKLSIYFKEQHPVILQWPFLSGYWIFRAIHSIIYQLKPCLALCSFHKGMSFMWTSCQLKPCLALCSFQLKPFLTLCSFHKPCLALCSLLIFARTIFNGRETINAHINLVEHVWDLRFPTNHGAISKHRAVPKCCSRRQTLLQATWFEADHSVPRDRQTARHQCRSDPLPII